MQMIRSNIFETNSSSTHSLTYLKRGHKLPKRYYKKNYKGEVLPIIWDYPNLKVEVRSFQDGSDNSDLSVPEQNASYLFTWLQLKKYRLDWYGNNTDKEVDDALAQFHLMLLELDVRPEYKPFTVEYKAYDYNYESTYPDDPKVVPAWEIKNAYMEMNDGGFIESLDDVWKIIDTKEHLRDFLTKGKIKVKYCG